MTIDCALKERAIEKRRLIAGISEKVVSANSKFEKGRRMSKQRNDEAGAVLWLAIMNICLLENQPAFGRLLVSVFNFLDETRNILAGAHLDCHRLHVTATKKLSQFFDDSWAGERTDSSTVHIDLPLGVELIGIAILRTLLSL